MKPENPVAAATHSTGPHERCPRMLFLCFDVPVPGFMFWHHRLSAFDFVRPRNATDLLGACSANRTRIASVGFGSVPNLWDSRDGAPRVFFCVLAAGYPFTPDRRWSVDDGVMFGEFGSIEQHVRCGVEQIADSLKATPQALVATAHDFWFYGT